MSELWTTLTHRPYVFAFLAVYLLLSTWHLGILRSLIWLAIGYGVALASEASSIRNGFPYGMYHYLYEGLQGELILGGVPVWDSLSYVFISYAAYTVAQRFVAKGFRLVFLTAFFTMMADVVIDPVANLGERWFLGKIYFYPEPGIYFGVPLSNFAGWFLVGGVIPALYLFLDRFGLTPGKLPAWGVRQFRNQSWLGPLFYFGILSFNLCMTFWIGEWKLGMVGLMLFIVLGTKLVMFRPIVR